MNKSEWEELLEALTKASRSTSTGEPISGPVEAGGTPTAAASKPQTIEALVESITGRPAAAPEPVAATKITQKPKQDDSAAVSALKTVGKFTGISPVITGLFKIFGGGGGDDESTAVTPVPYELPGRVAIDAGVTRDRSVTAVSYGQQGTVRGESQAAPVQITVQAIDSRSFLDHRDEIARAVREAMLNSHSLNDVVSEL